MTSSKTLFAGWALFWFLGLGCGQVVDHTTDSDGAAASGGSISDTGGSGGLPGSSGSAGVGVAGNGDGGASSNAGAGGSQSFSVEQAWTLILEPERSSWPAGVALEKDQVVVVRWSLEPSEQGGVIVDALDFNGAQRWHRAFAPEAGPNAFLSPVAIRAVEGGGTVVVGLLSTTIASAWVARLDPSGALIWATTIDGFEPLDFTVSPDGTSWLAGHFGSYPSLRAGLVEVSPGGLGKTLIDEAAAPPHQMFFSAIRQGPNGDLVVVQKPRDEANLAAGPTQVRTYVPVVSGVSLSSSFETSCEGILALGHDSTIFLGDFETGQPTLRLCVYSPDGVETGTYPVSHPDVTHLGLSSMVVDDEGQLILCGFAYPTDPNVVAEEWLEGRAGGSSTSWTSGYRGEDGAFAYHKGVDTRGSVLVTVGMVAFPDAYRTYVNMRVLHSELSIRIRRNTLATRCGVLAG